MKLFWLSWWDPLDGAKGDVTDGIVVWVSGTRQVGDRLQDSCCALVVAEDLAKAWGRADRYYPGASIAERRSEEEHEIGWRPGDRFPITRKQERSLARVERR